MNLLIILCTVDSEIKTFRHLDSILEYELLSEERDECLYDIMHRGG